jgi:archaemetzincin
MVRVVLVPIGDVPNKQLSDLAKGLEQVIYNSKVVVSKEPLKPPENALDLARGQYLASEILRRIAKAYGDPFKHLCLGVTTLDLYAPGLNFIFGEADRIEGVAIVSSHRLKASFYGGPEDERLLNERLLKEAVHEVGHLLGLPHCKGPSCVMRFSNWIGEVDAKEVKFCPNCNNKVKTSSKDFVLF